LPDGSSVELNAESTISYHPFWWFASRRISLEGEAFFRVAKGKTFSVHSSLATTRVLGTSFNIYARNSRYVTQCHSGSVKVESALNGKGITLEPGEEARVDVSGEITSELMEHRREVPAWTEHLVLFVSTPLNLVLEEIERQYGIVIEGPANTDLIYTGNFSLDESVENVLTLICRPFGLEYEMHTGKIYRIKAKRSP
ncbi:MAG: FecR domain-containing protein, partial [Spirochaetales bacterium]|nr:FecR domain-containing protein [Spirochaetales bacterium]